MNGVGKATKFEVGKYYRICGHPKMIVKVVKKNDDTNYMTVQYLNRETGELYNHKHASKVTTYGAYTPQGATERMCVERGGWGSFDVISDNLVKVFFNGVELD